MEEDSHVRAVQVKAKYQKDQTKSFQKEYYVNRPKECTCCGKDPQHKWNQGKCPAKSSVCLYCHKPNHLRTIDTVTVDEETDTKDEEILSINLTSTSDVNSDKWTADIEILSQKVPFRIDTGAKCNTLTLNVHSKCYSHILITS